MMNKNSDQDQNTIKHDKENLSHKKLTLGSNRLNKVAQTLNNAGLSSITIKVNQGKVVKNNKIVSNNELEIIPKNDEIHNMRRLNALQKMHETNLLNLEKTDYSDAAVKSNSSKNSVLKKISEEVVEDKTKNEIKQVQKESESNIKTPIKDNNKNFTNLATEKKDQTKDEIKISSSHDHNGVKDKNSHYKQEKKLEEQPAINKTKLIEPKKLKKSDLFKMLNENSNEFIKQRSLASIKRAKEKERRKSILTEKKQEKIYREVIIPEFITVADLSNRMTEKASDVIKELMKLGVIATNNKLIDADTAELIVSTFGHKFKHIQESDVENILLNSDDNPENLINRAPIVTIMGHVDHGKTSLLDAIKSTNVVLEESGGITQNIAAYSINVSSNKMITFIDTPGHEAFTAMRTRGAQVTDIVVLVIAADDGIKTQTIEAINHAKAANATIIIAINKIDKQTSNIDKIKKDLLSYELVTEEFGGNIITVPISAKNKINLDKLQEMILLIAEMQELKANKKITASGVIIESKTEKGIGIITTIIVKHGYLKKNDLIVVGTTYGRVKKMKDYQGNLLLYAGPSLALTIEGLNDIPSPGEIFNVVSFEKQAKDIVNYRKRLEKEKKSIAPKINVDSLFQKASNANASKRIILIIKSNIYGTIEAIKSSLNKIAANNEIELKIIHSAIGDVNESDISLAQSTKALIIGFNIKISNTIAIQANQYNVKVKCYNIIYELINDMKSLINSMISPTIIETHAGTAIVRKVFNISKVGKIVGCYISNGIIKKGFLLKINRQDIMIYKGKLKTLKRLKDDVKEVREGVECGIGLEDYSEEIKENDIIYAYEMGQ